MWKRIEISEAEKEAGRRAFIQLNSNYSGNAAARIGLGKLPDWFPVSPVLIATGQDG